MFGTVETASVLEPRLSALAPLGHLQFPYVPSVLYRWITNNHY